MTTTVEIYDERELQPDTMKPEPDAEALAIIGELGLKLQVSDSGARIAYPSPTADQAFILNVLFPTATKLENYDAGCIPLRVLKEIRSYRAEHPEHVLVVRHCAPAQVKDPVLLAYTQREHPWMWEHQGQDMRGFRLIARWGDGLESWTKLMDRARGIMAERADHALSKIARRANMLRELLASNPSYPVATLPELTGLPEGW